MTDNEELEASFQQCPAFANHELVSLIHADLQAIKEQNEKQTKKLEEMAEILSVWNSTKGFMKTMGWIVKALKWIAVAAATFYGFYLAVKHGVQLLAGVEPK